MSAATFSAQVAGAGFVGLKSNSSSLCQISGSITWKRKIASNSSKTYCMKVKSSNHLSTYISLMCLN